MDKEIIKQLSSMQAEVIDKLEQKENQWENLIAAYKLCWQATDIYAVLQIQERLELISYSLFFSETIGEIASVVLTHEADLLSIANEVICQIGKKEAELEAARKDLEPEIIKLGDVAGYKASRVYTATLAMQDLQHNAKIALDFARIMCDITGSNSTESEGYQQYNKLYNMLAKFLKSPLRGYDNDDWPAMSIDELEYIDAQISVRVKTERMAPFTISALLMMSKQIKERIALQKKILSDDELPDV